MIRYLICIPAIFLVGYLSCVGKADFRTLFHQGLDILPITEPARLFLQGHYKIGHSVSYGLLTLCFYCALKGRPLLPPLLAFAFGVAMELVQALLPTRANSMADLGYNLAGIAVACLLCALLPRLRFGAASRA